MRENADKEGVKSCNRYEGGVCTKKGKGLPVVKRRKRGGKGIYLGTVEEGIYLAVKVTTNSTSVFYRKKGWKETDSAELQVFE